MNFLFKVALTVVAILGASWAAKEYASEYPWAFTASALLAALLCGACLFGKGK